MSSPESADAPASAMAPPEEPSTPARRPLTANLDNGLTVVYEAMPWLPSISAALLVPFGTAHDPDGAEGTATVLGEWLQRGAGALDSRALSGAFEDLGVRTGCGTGREATTVSASFLATELEAAMPLIASMVKAPRLEDEEFEPSRELAVQELESLDDAPAQKLFDELVAAFLAPPYGRSAYGTADGLRSLTPAGTRSHAARYLTPRGAVLALAGGGDWDRVRGAVEASFSDWSGEPVDLGTARVAGAHRHHVAADSAQVHIGLAFPGPQPGTAEGYANSVALSVLSGSMGSRLFTEVREKRGLVYSVSAFARAMRRFGYVIGYAGTTPERAAETLEVFLAELRRLTEGVTAAEHARALEGILSSLVMQGESSGATASRLASDQFNLGRARTLDEVTASLRAVSLDQLNAYVAEHPVPEPTIVTLGPAAVASEVVA